VCFEVEFMAVTVANSPPAGPPVDSSLLLRPDLVAGWLGVTARTLANWAASGKVPFHRNQHGHLRFVAAELGPTVAAMGRVVPPLPASIAQQHPQLMLAVVDPPNSSAAEPDHTGEDGQPAGQERMGQTPIASVQLGRFLVKQRFYGVCDETTAELFFDEGRESGYRLRDHHQAAKAICALCPILGECRLVGRADPTLVGIWGGETSDERRQARRRGVHDDRSAVENREGRRLAGAAAQLVRRDGFDAAARALQVPPATLRRVFALYGLDQPPGPAGPSAAPKGGEPPWPPAARRQAPATTTQRSRRGSTSRSSSRSRAGR
jgi:WhiB family transcriptional regulator, redox-sensing transcriptional regulator